MSLAFHIDKRLAIAKAFTTTSARVEHFSRNIRRVGVILIVAVVIMLFFLIFQVRFPPLASSATCSLYRSPLGCLSVGP